MTVLTAAQTLGRASGWTLSNLPMQKTLYVAQGLHLAQTGRPLFDELFEAWDYGPVVRSLYHIAKRFNRNPVKDVFGGLPFADETTEAEAIREAWATARTMTPGQLVNYTHRTGGAWEQVYSTERLGIIIPNELIRREWDHTARASNEAVDWALTMAAQIEARPNRYLGDQDERAFRARLRGASLQ